MALQILGGVAKGFKITALTDPQLRPTSVLLRRKIFDAFQNLEGIDFFDLCAGTGAMGMEAWSRGARSVTAIEKSAKHYRLLQDNVREFQLRYKQQLSERPFLALKGCGLKWLERKREWLLDAQHPWVIFIDPPYHDQELYQKFLKQLDFVKDANRQVWIEIDEKLGPQLESSRRYQHGHHSIVVLDS